MQLTGEIKNTTEIMDALLLIIDVYIDKLNNNLGDELYHTYIELLYRYKRWNIFEANGHAFNGQIRGVMPNGRLIIETEGGQLKDFMFGEVSYVI